MGATSVVERYLNSPRAVHGWLDGYSARVIAELGSVQGLHSIAGAVGEIGVHEGRLFILLRLLRRPGEKSVAIDVFEDQHLNVDGSGRGNLGKFEQNVDTWSGRDDLVVIKRSSLEVTPDELLHKAGKFRLFSVDGGHTEECAFSDLRLAEAVLAPGGIIILDDFSNHHWPSVAAGAARFLLDRKTRVRPFATSPNKMYVASPEYHDLYRTALATAQGQQLYRSCTMFGHQVDIYEAPRAGDAHWRQLPGIRAATSVARRAKRLWNRLGG
jgi:hypothetical protein